MNIDLDNMGLAELRELRGQVDRAISGFQDRKRREAVAAAEETARAHGFSSLAELTGSRRRGAATSKGAGKPGRPIVKGEARYANPDNPEQTWTGRGRRPGWFQEAIEGGRSPDDLLV